MRIVVDNNPSLEKGDSFYRTQDIIEMTGWTTDELHSRILDGKFPPFILVERLIWPRSWVDHLLKKHE